MADRTHDFEFEQKILLENLRQQGALPEDWISQDLQPPITQVGGVLKKVHLVMIELRNNGELTPVGRQKRLNEVAQAAQKEVLAILSSRITSYEERMASVRVGMQPKRTAPDARSEMRAVEIRSALRLIDPLLRQSVIEQAMRENDMEAFFAVVDAPKLTALVSQELLDTLQAQWGTDHAPDEALKLKRLTTCRNTLNYARTRALSELHSVAPTAVSVQPVIMLDVAA